ncbi:MAG: helix-turn-helix domain-containing protein [Candidatus Gracilibacteria bacterium]|nr:helix-turn-helix domain-containing protein [Candidatus Gracilibacteria bacterium]
MYKLTRQEAADQLNISTRSVDRYIKAGKLRTRKDGKIVYVHKEDIENFKNPGTKNQEIIVPSKKVEVQKDKNNTHKQEISQKNDSSLAVLDNIYVDLKNEIQKKDIIIQDLSIKLGRAEEIAKNSVSSSDFNKTQLLLEEGREIFEKEINNLKHEKYKLLKDLKYEKSTNTILIGFIFVLIIVGIVIWFINV